MSVAVAINMNKQLSSWVVSSSFEELREEKHKWVYNTCKGYMSVWLYPGDHTVQQGYGTSGPQGIVDR